MIITNAILKKKTRSIVAVILFCSFLGACEIFEKEERLVVQHKKTNGASIKVYYVAVGSTTNEVMQVRKVSASGIETLVAAFEKYNYLEGSALMDDTTLLLILRDTLNIENKQDTIRVNVK